MNVLDRVVTMARNDVDMETMTMVLRSEGVPDSEIGAAYQKISSYSITEVVRGQYYIRLV